jgi:hypothetical protein
MGNKANMIIGLDISSTCIGLAFFENNQYQTFFHKPNKKLPEYIQIQKAINWINKTNSLVTSTAHIINIESPALAFSKFTTAKTLSKLISWNSIISFELSKSYQINHVNVNTARANLRKLAHLNSRIKKENVPNTIELITNTTFPYIISKKGKIKPETYDMADALAMAMMPPRQT